MDNIIGGISEGSIIPMSFEVLDDLASEWVDLLPKGLTNGGPLALLRTARSLFVHSWFDYEFMVVACLVGFQALEAAFRQLYPDATDRTPFGALVRRAARDDVLPENIAELADTAVELRNWLSHPATAGAFTVGMAGLMLENTHRLVALVLSAASARDTGEPSA